MCVGRVPNAGILAGLLELDELGRVPTDAWTQTQLPGLFAVGGIRRESVGQAITVAGEGATAAIAAGRLLEAVSVGP